MSLKQVLPDARDGLTEKERIILYCLQQLQNELSREFVPSIMLYGRVCEFIDITERDLQSVLQAIGKSL